MSSPDIQKIINADISTMKQMLQDGRVTSELLVNIFTQRCIDIGRKMSLITDVTYDKAIQKARQYDQLRKTNPSQCQGELFGVVISIKDTIDMEGYPSTVGCSSRLGQIQTSNGTCVKVLEKAGAIVIVRGNVPQLAMTFDSVNNIFGRAQNPWDPRRVVGGSSGGESALVAARCVPVGIGSDIGGSVRIPPAFCGVVGFKPTTTRMSFKGHNYYNHYFNGQSCIPAVLGPMAKKVDDCALVIKSFLNPQNYADLRPGERDHHYQIVPFKDQIYNSTQKRVIGYFKTQKFFDASLANQRAVQIAVDALTKRGHVLKEIKMPKFTEAVLRLIRVMTGGGFETYEEMLRGEKEIDPYTLMFLMRNIQGNTRRFISKLLSLLGQTRLSQLMDHSSDLTAGEDRYNSSNIFKMRDEFFEFWASEGIDAIIAPSFASPALLPHLVDPLTMSACYTFIWNVYNVPAGIVPVTLVQQDEQHYENAQIRDLLFKAESENMRNTAGLPVTVQVVTLPNQEELCLNIMKQIEDEVNFKEVPPMFKNGF